MNKTSTPPTPSPAFRTLEKKLIRSGYTRYAQRTPDGAVRAESRLYRLVQDRYDRTLYVLYAHIIDFRQPKLEIEARMCTDERVVRIIVNEPGEARTAEAFLRELYRKMEMTPWES